jgi:hypothetical protein
VALRKLKHKAEAKQLLAQAQEIAENDPTTRNQRMAVDVRSLENLASNR